MVLSVIFAGWGGFANFLSCWSDLRAMTWAAGIILAVLFVGLAYVGTAGRFRKGPDSAQAIGCIWAFNILVAIVGLVLGVAAYFQVGWIVRPIVWTVLGMTALVVPQLIRELHKDWRKKRARMKRYIPPDQLVERLSGRTHVIARVVDHSLRTELWNYSAYGKLDISLEKDGKSEPLGEAAQWTVEKNCLVIRAGDKTTYYTLWESRDGEITYFLHEPDASSQGIGVFSAAAVR